MIRELRKNWPILVFLLTAVYGSILAYGNYCRETNRRDFEIADLKQDFSKLTTEIKSNNSQQSKKLEQIRKDVSSLKRAVYVLMQKENVAYRYRKMEKKNEKDQKSGK